MARAGMSVRMTLNNFREAEHVFDRTSWNTLKKMGLFLVPESKKRCPVDKGQLRGSIQYILSKAVGNNYLTIGATALHGIFVHEGTRKMRARPFIKNAILENISRLKTVAQEEYRRIGN